MKRLTKHLTSTLTVVALLLLTFSFFWKLALTNLIMVGVDIFTYFYPYRAVVNEALAQGRWPLWNPDLFMGVPLLANAQAGVLYPFNWLFVALPAPQAINYTIVLHVFLAAVFFCLFARDTLRLDSYAALLAASVYAFSGFMGSLVEHVNQLQAATWFPLLVWCLDKASVAAAERKRWVGYILLGSLVFAIQFLAGHAQVSYISLVGLGLWTLGKVRHWSLAMRHWRSFIRNPKLLTTALQWPLTDYLLLMTIVVMGLALSALQLLPMLELSQLSIRGGGMTFREVVAFSLAPSKLLVSLLPTYGLGEAVFSEYVAFVGVSAWLLAAVGSWRIVAQRSQLHYPVLWLLVAGFILALGLYTPLYYVFYKLVPGFGLFRAPARWLFLMVFALASLAGIGWQSANGKWRITNSQWPFAIRNSQFAVGIGIGITMFVCLVGAARLRWLELPPLTAMLLWFAVGVIMLIIMARPVRAERAIVWRIALMGLVCGELFMATRWLPYNQPTAPEAYSSLRPAIAYLKAQNAAQPFRVLSYSDLTWDPGDLPDLRTMFTGQLSDAQIYQYTVAVKAKEIVAPNLAMRYHLPSVDGYDGGVLPLRRFVGLQTLFLDEAQVNPDGRLRERLRAMPEARWLDLFNVRYVIADKIFDVWVDGVYYDLGLGLTLRPNDTRSYALTGPLDFEATGIGVISYLREGASLPDDTPIAELNAIDTRGNQHTFVMRAGRATAESVYANASHQQARAVHTLRDQPNAHEYHTAFNFDTPTQLAALTVRALHPKGDFVLRGLTLIDARAPTGKPVLFAAAGQWRIAQSGDIKLYERLDAAPRAQVIHRAEVIADDAQALRRMTASAFDPNTQLILAAGHPLQLNAPTTAATIQIYTPERIVLTTRDDADGYLLLKDAWYPGWRAWVDGQPTTIERANTYFRALFVRGGAHTVELRFEPDTVRWGAFISGVLVCLYGSAWVWALRNPKGLGAL
jgi:hypothetical protein